MTRGEGSQPPYPTKHVESSKEIMGIRTFWGKEWFNSPLSRNSTNLPICWYNGDALVAKWRSVVTVLPTIISDMIPFFSWLVLTSSVSSFQVAPLSWHIPGHTAPTGFQAGASPLQECSSVPLVPRTPCLLTQQPVDRPSQVITRAGPASFSVPWQPVPKCPDPLLQYLPCGCCASQTWWKPPPLTLPIWYSFILATPKSPNLESAQLPAFPVPSKATSCDSFLGGGFFPSSLPPGKVLLMPTWGNCLYSNVKSCFLRGRWEMRENQLVFYFKKKKKYQ